MMAAFVQRLRDLGAHIYRHGDGATFYRGQRFSAAWPTNDVLTAKISHYGHYMTVVVALFGLAGYWTVRPFLKGENCESGWGFHVALDGGRFYWNRRNKGFSWPWCWTIYRQWVAFEGFAEKMFWIQLPEHFLDAAALATHWKADFSYTKNGCDDHTVADVMVEMTELRRWCLRWTWLGHRVDRRIRVKFLQPIGPGKESWKGGTYGTGLEMLAGEDWRQALTRLEVELQLYH